MLPDVLAKPPWPPARKRKVLSLAPPEHEERIVWASPEERGKWCYNATGGGKKLELWEREEILTKLESCDIVPIHAAFGLEKEDLLQAMRTCNSRFIDHYGILRVALAKLALDVLDAILAVVHKAPVAALEVLSRVDSLRVIPAIAHDATFVAAWSEKQPFTAALAAIPAALGPSGGGRKNAIKVLAWLRRAGYAEAVSKAAASFGEDAVDEVNALFGPEPLPSRPPALPSFVQRDALPKVHLREGGALGAEAEERLLQLLVLLPLGAARDALASVKPACTAESLDGLAAALFAQWEAAGSPSGHNWIILAGGALGDDLAARKLAEQCVAWAKAGQHPRSRVALEALSLISSDVALMHVDRIARSMKGKLKTNLLPLTLDAIAKERGLSHEELGGTASSPHSASTRPPPRWLDAGPRRFRVSFDEALVPELFDEAGVRLPRIPRAAKDDDVDKGRARHRHLQAPSSPTLKKLAPDQVRRLERAMCAQRSWSAADFRRLFLDHPLMVHLARRLVWSTSGGETFRPTDARELVGALDEPFVLPDDARVRLAHPILLGPELIARWSTLLGDYQVVQPFPQLGREVNAFTDDERPKSTVTRFAGRPIPGNRFCHC